MEALDIVGLVLLVGCALLVAMVFRRWMLSRHGGTLEMSLCDRHWRFGVARYDGDRLTWFATFSLSPRPRHSYPRAALKVVSRRAPHGAESLHVVRDSTILHCAVGLSTVDLAVPSSALPGFLAWLEAAPKRAAA